jgi:hypothetical protein
MISHVTIHGRRPLVLLVGVGDLTTRLAHLLCAGGAPFDLILASRDEDRAIRYANLVRLAASNLGFEREVHGVQLDIGDIAHTAEVLATLRADLIFIGASIQPARAIAELPEPLFEMLDAAQLGPWLPMHLTLSYEIMQAVRASGTTPLVVNSAYPDAVGPVLASVKLAPTVGVGNVANIVPGLRHAAALQLAEDPGAIELRVVAHHFFSHRIHRMGDAGGARYRISVATAEGSRDIDEDVLFRAVAKDLRRQGGCDGQQITACSAMRVIEAILGEEPRRVHAPAPNGYAGGYPILCGAGRIALDLPAGLDLATAQEINESGQLLDGIAEIAPGGVVRFKEEQMDVLRRSLGYSCEELRIEDCREAAVELGARYQSYLLRHV